MKRNILLLMVAMLILIVSVPLFGVDHQHPTMKSADGASTAQKAIYPSLPDPGKKVPIGGGYYLIYGFNKTPKLGMVIMKVEIFTEEGKKDTSLQVKADSGMPSMRGAHETGDAAFKLSNKGDYLLPINIVMPGDWEIRLSIIKEGNIIFRGRYNFDV